MDEGRRLDCEGGVGSGSGEGGAGGAMAVSPSSLHGPRLAARWLPRPFLVPKALPPVDGDSQPATPPLTPASNGETQTF